jgi:hypothetical protein
MFDKMSNWLKIKLERLTLNKLVEVKHSSLFNEKKTVLYRRHQLSDDISRVDIDGTDGHDLLTVTL